VPRRLIEDAWTTTRSRQIVWRGALLGINSLEGHTLNTCIGHGVTAEGRPDAG